VEFEIDPRKLKELRELIGARPLAQPPFYFYWAEADILEVFCGEPPFDSCTPVYMSHPIFKGVSLIRKSYPEDIKDGDSFAGLEFWGGVANFLSHSYLSRLGVNYSAFRLRYNGGKLETPVLEIIEALVADPRGLTLPLWEDWRERVMNALSKQNPKVHIPLLKL
jgi:hypothetical protein